MSDIPRISLKNLEAKDLDTIKELKDALEHHGFFALYDHSIDLKTIEQCYQKSKEFFNLETEIKNKYANPAIGGARGYTPFGKETALGESVPDLKEFWHHGPKINETFDKRIHKNITIDEVNDLFDQLNELAINVLSCISLTIGLTKDYFHPWVMKGNSLLRMIHYPPSDNDNIYRAREHADINLITLLIGAEERGLEVKSKDNSWSAILEICCNLSPKES